MRCYPASWSSKTLAKLGFRRFARKRRSSARPFGRAARLEQLEARQMLAGMVNTLADTVDSDETVTSLREALMGGGAVEFDSALNGGTILLSSGQLSIAANTTISGPGADKLAIDAHGASRVFAVGANVDATISGVTITGGGMVTEGAGIYSVGQLTLQSVAVIGNQTTWAMPGDSSSGGGVRVENAAGSDNAWLKMYDTTIDGNHARYGGGVSVHLGALGSLDIQRNTLSNNIAMNSAQDGAGGGLHIGGTANGNNLNIYNTTISNNVAAKGAGIYFESGSTGLSVFNSTIVENRADAAGGYGGGISIWTGAAVGVANTIIARNSAAIPVFAEMGSWRGDQSL